MGSLWFESVVTLNFLGAPCPDAHFPHQSGYPGPAAFDASLPQIQRYPRAPIGLVALFMDILDSGHDSRVLFGSGAFRSPCPGIVSADSDVKNPAHRPDSKDILVFIDKAINQ